MLVTSPVETSIAFSSFLQVVGTIKHSKTNSRKNSFGVFFFMTGDSAN
jgi:hypothetical protein